MASKEKLQKLIKNLLVILLILNLFVWVHINSVQPDYDALEITFLDVGQGDSTLIKTPGNKFGLIDAGRGDAVLSSLEENLPGNTKELEFLLLTHPDADHIEGSLEILKRYKVKNIFIAKTTKENSLLDELENQLKSYDNPNFELNSATDFELNGVEFDVIWPLSPGNKDFIYHSEFDNYNDLSTGIIIRYKAFELLATGDLSSDYELLAIQNSEIQDIDVLKVGHHGSDTSTSSEFLEIAKPEVSVISAGKDNSYGHPAEEVIDNLEDSGAVIYETAVGGDIKVWSDGERIVVKNLMNNNNLDIKL